MNTGTTTGSSNAPVLERMAFRPQPFFTSAQAGQEWSGLGRVETERVGTADPLPSAQSRTPLADSVRLSAYPWIRNCPLTLLPARAQRADFAWYLEHPEEGRVASNETDPTENHFWA